MMKSPILAPDDTTRRAVEAAAEAARKAMVKPGCCTEGAGCELPPCHCARVAAIGAITAFLTAMGQGIAAARVRRCGDQPASKNDAAFLTTLMDRVRARDRVSLADVARLRRLADWADAAPAPGWDGTLDPGETERAVDDARRRMG